MEALKNVEELMKINPYVNIDGTIDCDNAISEMVAYYMCRLVMDKSQEKAIHAEVIKLRHIARSEGFNWAEILVDAKDIAKSTMKIAKQEKLIGNDVVVKFGE